MTRKLPKYVQGWVDREGRSHHYFRRPGYPRSPLPGLPYSIEFMSAYSTAMAAAPVAVGAAKRSKPGSVAATIAAYLDSNLYFGSRAPGTQIMQRAILNRFREACGELPLAGMPPKFIAAVLEMKKPHAARNWLKTLRALCVFAVKKEWLRDDPTAGIKLPKLKKSSGHHTWNEEELAQFEAAHPIGSKARLAFALLLFTCQRRGDVIAMGPQHIRNRRIRMRQGKTGTLIDVPVLPELQEVFDATPARHLTFLVTKSGQPYRGSDFSEQFRKWCDAAGLPRRCVAHGLRKARCRRIAEAGGSPHHIMAWSGHKTLSEVKRYTEAADKARLADDAMDIENAARTKTVKAKRV